MASNVALSSGIRSNLISLQQTSSQMTAVQNRLASGKKVNSALDNPASFFTAQGLTDRASSMTSLLDGMSNGIQTVKNANSGLDSITKAVKSAQSIIAQAQSAATTKNTAAGATVTGATTFGGTADRLRIEDTSTNAIIDVDISSATSVQNVIDAVNTGTGGSYSASISDGKFTITANGGKTTGFEVSTVVASTGAINTTDNTTLTGAATALAGSLTSTLSQAQVTSYADQLNTILTSIDEFSRDSGYNGINLLANGSTLSVKFNENGSSKQEFTSKDFSAAAIGLTKLTGTGTSKLSDLTDLTDDLATALGSVKDFQTSLSTGLSIVQNRQDFSQNIINSLKTGSDFLINADPNEEASTLLALQTRQSLSQSALSLANQADQAVLQLLR